MIHDTPEAVLRAFVDLVAARDVESLVELYEAEATLAPEPGVRLTGRTQLRAALAQLLSLNPRLELNTEELLVSPELALALNAWSMRGVALDGSTVQRSGRSTVVLRRGADRGFRIAIDRL